MAAGYPERCGARWLRDGNSFNSFRTDRIILRMSQPPQTLAYATQPVYDNIIVTPCADGVSFTFLPNRRFLRQAIREFVGLTMLAAAFGGGIAFVALRNDSYWQSLLIVLALATFIIGRSIWKLIILCRTNVIEADANGLRYGPLKASSFQDSASWPRSRITDIVATRVSGRRPAGCPFFLQLRLNDGESVNFCYGDEEEIRWLAEH